MSSFTPIRNSIAFTPGLLFGGAAVGLAFSTQAGRYTRNGTDIHVELQLVISAKGSSVGAATISGLPFASLSGLPVRPALIACDGMAAAVTCPMAILANGASAIGLYNFSAGVLTALTDASVAVSSNIMISMIYKAP